MVEAAAATRRLSPTVVTTPPSTAPPTPKILTFTVSPTSITCKPGDQPGVEIAWTTANTTTVSLSPDGPTQTDFQPNDSASYEIGCFTHTASITITAIGQNGLAVTKSIPVSVLKLIT